MKDAPKSFIKYFGQVKRVLQNFVLKKTFQSTKSLPPEIDIKWFLKKYPLTMFIGGSLPHLSQLRAPGPRPCIGKAWSSCLAGARTPDKNQRRPSYECNGLPLRASSDSNEVEPRPKWPPNKECEFHIEKSRIPCVFLPRPIHATLHIKLVEAESAGKPKVTRAWWRRSLGPGGWKTSQRSRGAEQPGTAGRIWI